MITPAYSSTATERVLPRLALDFTTASLDSRVTVTRALNTATRTNKSGVLEIVNANLPRFDYDPVTFLCKGLLIEETRANLLLNSLIDGTNLSTQSVTLSATAYTLSFYGTGSIVISGGHSATVTGSGAYPTRKTYTFTPSAGSSTFTVSGTVQYAQLEAGAFATSFIPTTTTILTRNRDDVSMTGTNFSDWYQAGSGTLQAIMTRYPVSTGYPRIASINNNTVNNEIAILAFNPNNGIGMGVIDGGATQASTFISLTGNEVDMAFRYGANDFAISLNSSNVTTDTSGTVPTVSQMLIGTGPLTSSPICNGWYKKIMFFNNKLINNELRSVSKL